MAFLKPIIRVANRDLSKIYPLSFIPKTYTINYPAQDIILPNLNKLNIPTSSIQSRNIHFSNSVLNKEVAKTTSKNHVSEHTGGKKFADLSSGEKVKRVGNDITYTAIVIGGICITGAIFFSIGKELLSSDSVQGVYSTASKTLKNSYEVTDTFGDPIKVYGETSRRGRRKHIQHLSYKVGEEERIRMKFYIEGKYHKGTVHCEMRKEVGGHFEYRYLLVELDNSRTIILEDNRLSDSTVPDTN